MAKTSDRFREFARLGAAVRLNQLREEIRQIYKAFPGLRFAKKPRSSAENAVGGGAQSARRQKRRKLTGAQKKAISERMKKLWAKRRAGAGAAPKGKASQALPRSGTDSAGTLRRASRFRALRTKSGDQRRTRRGHRLVHRRRDRAEHSAGVVDHGIQPTVLAHAERPRDEPFVASVGRDFTGRVAERASYDVHRCRGRAPAWRGARGSCRNPARTSRRNRPRDAEPLPLHSWQTLACPRRTAGPRGVVLVAQQRGHSIRVYIGIEQTLPISRLLLIVNRHCKALWPNFREWPSAGRFRCSRRSGGGFVSSERRRTSRRKCSPRARTSTGLKSPASRPACGIRP